jgi:transposase
MMTCKGLLKALFPGRCHVSRRTNQWKTENDIPTLEWPPQSPDLNIIENVWKVIKTKVQ